MRELVRTNPVVHENRLPTNDFAEVIRLLKEAVEGLDTRLTALEARVTALETP